MTHLHYRIWSSTKGAVWKIPAKRGYANNAFVGEEIPSNTSPACACPVEVRRSELAVTPLDSPAQRAD
jgi:hypothetical protein